MAETADIWTINSKRAVMKIPVTSLCAQAGVGTRTWYDAMEGTKEPRPATLAKLTQALQRFRLAYGGDGGPLIVRAGYIAAVLLAAQMLKSDGKAALFSDPARKATGDPQWLAAARVRRLAFWMANGLMGFKVSEIGRAAGLTKQAVSKAITDVADSSDAEMQRVCAELERMFFMSKRDRDDITDTSQTVAAGQLRALIERIERLHEERKSIGEDIAEVFAEAKGTGFDTKAMKTIIRRRAKDQAQLQEEDAMVDLYMAALGML